MAKEPEPATYDYNAQLAEAIRLLAERVTPRPLDEDAQRAINSHRDIARSLRTVFLDTPDTQTTKY